MKHLLHSLAVVLAGSLVACQVGDGVDPADLADTPAAEVSDAADGIGPDGAGDPDADTRPLPPYTYPSGCFLPPDPGTDPVGGGDVELVEAFPNLPDGAIQQPLGMVDAGDGTGRLFVNERPGRIKVFDDDPDVDEAEVFLDITDKVYTRWEGGFLSMTFHPDYAENGYFYVSYTTEIGDQTTSVISRFSVSADDPDRADPESEHVILTVDQPLDNHNGGPVAFGPDGYLYVAFGDGGGGGDPDGNGQDTTTLLGAILRIDVDVPDGETYAIPEDNPFAQTDGPERDEIYAWGFRNPWRMSFDSLTGALWVGDVGQSAIEEVDIVEAGKNYGWNIMEGSACYEPPQGCSEEGLELPVAEYGHGVGQSITGGYVYRGSKVPSLYGAYLYADYEQRVLFAWKHGEEPPPEAPLLTTPGKSASFGRDADGEVYVLILSDGGIWRFQEAEGGEPAAEDFPQTLAETGCFDDVETLTPVEGVLPYEVNVPLWADTAGKDRWVVLPEGERMTWTDEDPWEVPAGTMFIKHFALDTTVGDPSTRVRLETRFLVKEEQGIRGYTYRWNEEGTEATLLDGAATRDLPLTLADGEAASYTWRFPSRQQCTSCHTNAAGGVLGMETGQMNRAHDYDGITRNQIRALAEWELLDGVPGGSVDQQPRFADVDEEAEAVSWRARSWLHANCANCHRPGATGAAAMDLRAHRALDEMDICDVEPGRGDLGIGDARILAPGAPERSVLLRRMIAGPPSTMPPISTSLPHHEALDVIEAWITALDDCE